MAAGPDKTTVGGMPARDGERSGSTEVEGTVRSGKVGSERRYLSLISCTILIRRGMIAPSAGSVVDGLT